MCAGSMLEFGEQVHVQPLPPHPAVQGTSVANSSTNVACTVGNTSSSGAASPSGTGPQTAEGSTSTEDVGAKGNTGDVGSSSTSTAQAEVIYTVTLPSGCPDWGRGGYSGVGEGTSTMSIQGEGMDGQAAGTGGLSVLVQLAGPAILQGTGVLAAWA
jgi:hypothetical protein